MPLKLYQPDIPEARGMPTSIYPDIIEARGTHMPGTFFKQRIELHKSLPSDVESELCDGITTLCYAGGNIVYLCAFVCSEEKAKKILGRKMHFLRERKYIAPDA